MDKTAEKEEFHFPKDLNFAPYEIAGIIFPGMGITYLDSKESELSELSGYPAIIFPEGRLGATLHRVLTAYAMEYYITDQKCFYFDKSILSNTLVKVRDFFFNLAALGFVVEHDNKWSLL